jgi:hypothetical protein
MISTWFYKRIYIRQLRLILSMVSTFVIVGCADVVKPIPEDPNAIITLEQNAYFPLKVGNTWKYQLTEYYSGGSKYVSTGYNKITNDATLTYKGRTYQCVQFDVSPNNNSQYVYFWSNSKEALRFNDFGAMRYTAKQIVVRQPIQAGDSVQMEFAAIYANSLVKDSQFAKCVTTNGSIVTPAGTFQNCIVIRYIDPILSDAISGGINYDYYAKGVGRVAILVKSQSTLNGVPTERLLDEYLLTSYTIVP